MQGHRITRWHFTKESLAAVQFGIVFIYAKWSGQSEISLRIFCSALAQQDGCRFNVLILDADEVAFGEFQAAFGELPQGRGETYWIRRGQIIHRDHGYKSGSEEVLGQRMRAFDVCDE